MRPKGRRARGTAAAFAALLVLAVAAGCGSVAPRSLPPGTGAPSFVIESFDAAGTLLLGTDAGVFRSIDGGHTWHPTFPRVYDAVTAAFTKGSTIVSRGLLVQRGNLQYDHVERPQRAPFSGGKVTAMAWLPGGKLYAVVRGRPLPLYVSLDSAQSWYARPALGMPRGVVALAAARVQNQADVLYAAAGRDGLWRSSDGGVHWQPLRGAGDDVTSVCTSPDDWTRVIATGKDVRWSDDYGRTWRNTGFAARLLACDPRNARLVFAVSREQPPRLHVSTDGGTSW